MFDWATQQKNNAIVTDDNIDKKWGERQKSKDANNKRKDNRESQATKNILTVKK